MKPIVFILSYERPLYLWASLDSIYRATRSDVNFVLIDSASQDPLVHKVIEGFRRRGMFYDVVKLRENNIDWAQPFFDDWYPRLGDYFFFIESDVIIREEPTCWVERMSQLMERNPKLAMLGSMIDRSDFTQPKEIECRLSRPLTDIEMRQLKLASPERTMRQIAADELSSPFNPPGRLLALKTHAVKECLGNFMQYRDSKMHKILISNNWETGIYGGVVHRHLSLNNYYDYYDDHYMTKRDEWMSNLDKAG